jgi:rhamnosyltransferase
MAHYDPHGLVAPHVLRQLDAWHDVADRLLLVSAADITDPDVIASVQSRAELVQRQNEGYDFYSYKLGLESVSDLGSYDLVVICNDSYIGPLVPWRTVIDAMSYRQVDAWGLTETMRRRRHVQSYFYAFRPWVVASRGFRRFWSDMQVVSDRNRVIRVYELGLSAAILDAGFEIGSYYRESERDRRIARARQVWWAVHRAPLRPKGKRLSSLPRFALEPWNQMSALADRALDGARLPVVKIDTLRYDPYRLGSGVLLDACERQYPREFAGVREFLQRTSAAYPGREGELVGAANLRFPARQLIGYAA